MEFIGFGSIRNLKFVLSQFQAKNLFLVTGNNSYEISGAKKYLTELLLPYNVTHFCQFKSYPKIEDVINGIELYKKSGCETTIAVGGGSVIDMAKLVTFFAENDLRPLEFLKNPVKETLKKISLAAIPTTAGSGSEATKFAVLYIDKQKFSVENESLLPSVAIIDPELTMSMSGHTTAVTGADALCQAIESYWNINSNKESKAFAGTSLKLIVANLEKAVNNPDPDSRLAMAKAAHLSGKAINITRTTACHAISYPLTTYFGIPHGHAVALTMSKIFEINSSEKNTVLNNNLNQEHLAETMKEICKYFGCEQPNQFTQKWETMMSNIGMEKNYRNLGVSKQSDFDLILNNINIERLKNNPVKIDRAMLEHVFADESVL